VWASNPGRAPKINPEIGIRMNSSGVSQDLYLGISLGRGGLCLRSIKTIIKRNKRLKVMINEENLGRLNPKAVLVKFLFKSIGMFTPQVIINQ